MNLKKMNKDIEIKEKLEKLVEETYKKPTTNPDWFKDFKVVVKHGIVCVEKHGIKSEHSFIYDEGAKDYYGNDWNLGALGNMVINWNNKNRSN